MAAKGFTSKLLLILMFFVLLQLNTIICQQVASFEALNDKFSHYEILNIDSKNTYERIQNGTDLDDFEIDLQNGTTWKLQLKISKLLAPNYAVFTNDNEQIKSLKGTTAIPTVGKIKNLPNSEVALTFNTHFVYGFIKIGFETYYIEPVHGLIATEPSDSFILYNAKDVINSKEFKCAYETDKEKLHEINRSTKRGSGNRLTGECIEIRYNIASDWSMRVKYGSNTGVENHNIGVMNDVQTNYDNEFADEIQFTIMQQYITSCSTCDPWTASTDAETLLNSFTAWAQNGFSATHDLAGLWTNRDLDGGTVGIAWVGVLCTSAKYHVLQDFSSNAAFLRVMTAHEIGHNFNASHDAAGSNTIMAPSVNSSTTWSAASIAAIQAEYGSASCLNNCAGSSVPVADFDFNVNSFCVPGQVQYFDQSTNAVSRTWSFPGGSPSSSTALNPIVNYNAAGTYNATLTVFNSSGNSSTKTINNVVSVINYAVANFSYTVSGNNVVFTFTGSNASTYFWDFGDGVTSNAINPTHTYLNDGVYSVLLSVSNSCGSDFITFQVTIATAPSAGFSSNVQSGCQPLTVNFINESSTNSLTYLWSFPGGNPSTSTLKNPTVTYANPGSYNVTLSAFNNNGTDIEVKNGFISVSPLPVPAFSYTVDEASVSFTNVSLHSTSYLWNFGDGVTSNAINPSHQFNSNGNFNVTLTANNACGPVSFSQQVTIEAAPVAAFNSGISATTCSGQVVHYNNTSTYGPSTYLWTFEGGIPATSTDVNPIVQYNNPGTYDVTLVVTNAFGSDELVQTDYLQVIGAPVVGFTETIDSFTVQFTASISGGTNPFWDFGDGQTSSMGNPTHTYLSEGLYEVSLRAENQCDTVLFSKYVLVQLAPQASFNGTSTNVCVSDTVYFFNQSSPTVTEWTWTFEGGNPSTSNEANPIVHYDTPGTYSVTLVVHNLVGQDSLSINDLITVTGLPSTGYEVNLIENLIELVNISAPVDSVLWTITDGNDQMMASGDSIVYVAPQNGVYSLTQTTFNFCGSSTTEAQEINLSAYAEANFITENGCVNQPVAPENLSVNALSYAWHFENGVPAESNVADPVVFYSQPGEYNISLIVSNTLGVDTFISSIIVSPDPVAGFEYIVLSSQVDFEFTGNNTSAYFWDFGDGSTSDLENPSHSYTASGNYLVKQISENACSQDTVSKILNIIISSTHDVGVSPFTLYPNPGNGHFYLDVKNARPGRYQYQIYDLLGRLIVADSLHIQDQSSMLELNFEWLQSSSYVLKIAGEKQTFTSKLVVSK